MANQHAYWSIAQRKTAPSAEQTSHDVHHAETDASDEHAVPAAFGRRPHDPARIGSEATGNDRNASTRLTAHARTGWPRPATVGGARATLDASSDLAASDPNVGASHPGLDPGPRSAACRPVVRGLGLDPERVFPSRRTLSVPQTSPRPCAGASVADGASRRAGRAGGGGGPGAGAGAREGGPPPPPHPFGCAPKNRSISAVASGPSGSA